MHTYDLTQSTDAFWWWCVPNFWPKKRTMGIVGCHVVSIPVPKSREDDMDSKVICIHHAVGAGNDFQMDTCHWLLGDLLDHLKPLHLVVTDKKSWNGFQTSTFMYVKTIQLLGFCTLIFCCQSWQMSNNETRSLLFSKMSDELEVKKGERKGKKGCGGWQKRACEWVDKNWWGGLFRFCFVTLLFALVVVEDCGPSSYSIFYLIHIILWASK